MVYVLETKAKYIIAYIQDQQANRDFREWAEVYAHEVVKLGRIIAGGTRSLWIQLRSKFRKEDWFGEGAFSGYCYYSKTPDMKGMCDYLWSYNLSEEMIYQKLENTIYYLNNLKALRVGEKVYCSDTYLAESCSGIIDSYALVYDLTWCGIFEEVMCFIPNENRISGLIYDMCEMVGVDWNHLIEDFCTVNRMFIPMIENIKRLDRRCVKGQ